MTRNDGKLQGKTVIVTGAGGDLGRAMATLFSDEGANLVCADLDEASAGETAASAGSRALAVRCDVTDEGSAAETVERAVQRFGALHGLVNNAAAPSVDGTVAALSLADWNREITVSLTGAFLMSKHAIPRIAASGGGSIIHVASQFGHVGVAGSAAYCAAKAGLVNLAKVMALDHARDGIRVNSLSPGAIATSRVTRRYGGEEAAQRALGPKHPIGRIARPAEIAKAALFLLAEDSGFMTGSDLLVDGGYTAW